METYDTASRDTNGIVNWYIQIHRKLNKQDI